MGSVVGLGLGVGLRVEVGVEFIELDRSQITEDYMFCVDRVILRFFF